MTAVDGWTGCFQNTSSNPTSIKEKLEIEWIEFKELE